MRFSSVLITSLIATTQPMCRTVSDPQVALDRGTLHVVLGNDEEAAELLDYAESMFEHQHAQRQQLALVHRSRALLHLKRSEDDRVWTELVRGLQAFDRLKLWNGAKKLPRGDTLETVFACARAYHAIHPSVGETELTVASKALQRNQFIGCGSD